jgi:hypothetical protein
VRSQFRACLLTAVLVALSCSDAESDGSAPNPGGSGGSGVGASGTGSGTGGGTNPDGSLGSSGASGSGGMSGAGGSAAGAAGASAGSGAGGSGGPGGSGTGGAVGSGGNSIGAPTFGDGDLDPASNGGTITFQSIGAPGWYPSRRDPASGQCDAYRNGDCCMTRHELSGNELAPWNEDLIMTLRGPVLVKQIAVYQPSASAPGTWQITSAWDDRSAQSPRGMAFSGNDTEQAGFSGVVGSECLVDLSSDKTFPCGPGSSPYCPPLSAGQKKYHGWEGSKLLVLLAAMPHASSSKIGAAEHCGQGTSGGWYDAPWVGLSHGELVRSGKFGSCHCYAKNPAEWYLGDGCGQFNVFEVVNDNNQYKNLDLFSTNFFGYAGYVGEGPCGMNCNLTGLGAAVDLIDKSSSTEAASGATAAPGRGPGAAFRRPAAGYRYFVMLLDQGSRTVQLAIVHPRKIPAGLAALLPDLPLQIPKTAVDGVLATRLPR